MNELEQRKILKFKNKSFLLEELSNALLSLNKSTQKMIQKLEKGVEYTEFVKIFMNIIYSLAEVEKYLDAKVVTNLENGGVSTTIVKTLDSKFIVGIAIDIKDMLNESKTNYSKERTDAYTDKIFDKLCKVFKDYHNIFNEYQKEALELGLTNE